MTKFEHALLLTILHHEPDAYGVPIRRELMQRLGRSVSFGAIYTALEQLENQGLICSQKGAATAERGGHEKLLWTVLPAGQRALTEHHGAIVDKYQKPATASRLAEMMGSMKMTKLLLLVVTILSSMIVAIKIWRTFQ